MIPHKIYTAKLIKVPLKDKYFKIAGTLDGLIDFAIPDRGICTYQLTLADTKCLMAALASAIADVELNCLS